MTRHSVESRAPPARASPLCQWQCPISALLGGGGLGREQRFRCNQCRKTFTEDHATPLETMRLPMDKADQVLRLMVEGMSIRSIERFTGIHRDTILRLMLLAAEKITTKLRHTFENLEIARIQIDELHCFVQKRERRVSIEESDEVGEQYTFIGMDEDTKLVFSWLTGKRTTANTITFMRDLYSRTAWGLRPQVTTDGWGPYRLAMAATFRDNADFAATAEGLQVGLCRTPEVRPTKILGGGIQSHHGKP